MNMPQAVVKPLYIESRELFQTNTITNHINRIKGGLMIKLFARSEILRTANHQKAIRNGVQGCCAKSQLRRALSHTLRLLQPGKFLIMKLNSVPGKSAGILDHIFHSVHHDMGSYRNKGINRVNGNGMVRGGIYATCCRTA